MTASTPPNPLDLFANPTPCDCRQTIGSLSAPRRLGLRKPVLRLYVFLSRRANMRKTSEEIALDDPARAAGDATWKIDQVAGYQATRP